jgi:DNA invertase Pin-like site-specific DNA recombinase
MLTILAGVATWEREIMLERQREGIAKAKAEGRYKGRPPSIDRAKVHELLTRMGPAEVAKTLGGARSSIYRMISRGRPGVVGRRVSDNSEATEHPRG